MASSEWTTYCTTGYSSDVANDPRSTGGVHHHQVRRDSRGRWWYRIKQSNGTHSATTTPEMISVADGEARMQRAHQEA